MKENIWYIPINELYPGQMRYSEYNVQLKIKEIYQKEAITKDGYFLHDEGKSPRSLSVPIPVMKVIVKKTNEMRCILCDKHHETIAVRRVASEHAIKNPTMPVKITRSFFVANFEDFYSQAHEEGFIDLVSLDGTIQSTLPQSFDGMIDDPLRYFVSMASCRLVNGQSIDLATGSQYPLFVKILAHPHDDSLPADRANACMLENKVAQKLRDLGFKYDPVYDGEQGERFNACVRHAHILLLSVKNWCDQIGLRLVDQPDHVEFIKDELEKKAEKPDSLL